MDQTSTAGKILANVAYETAEGDIVAAAHILIASIAALADLAVEDAGQETAAGLDVYDHVIAHLNVVVEEAEAHIAGEEAEQEEIPTVQDVIGLVLLASALVQVAREAGDEERAQRGEFYIEQLLEQLNQATN